MRPDHMDDAALWKALKSGDENALVVIFDRFTGPMFNYGYKIAGDRELVKDCIQELLIEIWQNRSRLGDTNAIKYYLFKSLRRKLARLKASEKAFFFESLPEEWEEGASPSHEVLMISDQLALEKRSSALAMLRKLTKRQQEVLFLRYFDELSCDEIAAVMDLSRQSVYNLIHDALARLRKT